MMRQGGETKGDTNSDEPTLLKRSLKSSGKLCYQWIYDEYVVKWYQNKLISAVIYNDIREELEALKKSKYGKKVLGADSLSQDKEKTLTQHPEVEAVRQLPSSPSPEQKQSQPCKNSAGDSNKTIAQGAQSSTKRFQNTKKHTDKTGSEVSTIPEQRKADKTGSQNAEVKDQTRLTEETKKKLLNEIERLKADVERAECEIRQLEQKNYDLNVRLADSSTGLHDLEETHSLTRKRLLKAEERAQELTLRLSKMAGDNIRQGNPNLADLSDPYRPTELGKIFSEIYDNEWSDAYEMIHNIDENSKIKVLYDILTHSYRFCDSALENQQDTINRCLLYPYVQDTGPVQDSKTNMVCKEQQFLSAVKDVRKKFAPETARHIAEIFITTELTRTQDPSLSGSIPEKLQNYGRKCTEVCWFMVICDPPLALSENKNGEKFKSEVFRPYTRSQKDIKSPVIEMAVWPALYLHEGGPLLSKGVAQPTSETEFKKLKKK